MFNQIKQIQQIAKNLTESHLTFSLVHSHTRQQLKNYKN